MVNARSEHRASQQRTEDVREQQIGDGIQLVAGRRMPGNLQTQLAEMLYRTPYLGAAGAQLFGNARTADDYRCVIAQQTNNAAQAGVRRTSSQ